MLLPSKLELISTAAALLLTMNCASAWAQEAVAQPSIEIELNKVQSEVNGCSLFFVVKNLRTTALEELRLEFIVFAKDGSIARRLVADLGPLKPARTTVKVFKTEDKCETIDGLLINAAKSCGKELKVDACLDTIRPSARSGLKLFM
jgi:hypothetical protein